MTVYVLTWGYDHESDSVCGVFTTRDRAEQVGKEVVGKTRGCHYDVTECEVEE